MSADLAIQQALRARLVADTDVSSLVPAANILDRNARPNPDPCIIIGEGHTLPGDDLARNVSRIFLDLHIWKKEPSLVGVKTIAGAVRDAVHATRPILAEGMVCGGWYISGMRYLRDPDGETSHGVVTVQAVVTGVPL